MTNLVEELSEHLYSRGWRLKENEQSEFLTLLNTTFYLINKTGKTNNFFLFIIFNLL